MERYFVKVDNAGEPFALYRLVDDAPIFAEEIWADGNWKETDRLVRYLIDGAVSLEEITADDANAFIAANAATPNA